MRLKVVASAVVADTAAGRFSARAQFTDGVNVISARNNRGKTTLLMGIVYALGMEGMLGPGKQMPLKPAAHELLEDENGVEHRVLSSYVMVEIENAAGERLTAQRYLKHDRFNSDLVRTWRAGKITDPDADVPERDYYTRITGSAKNEAGWHTRLAQFLGWELPRVTRYDGNESQLYMQVFFPLLFREQTRGWSSIFGSIPRYLQLRDPGRRAVEFLLSLDAYERARRREELRAKEAALTAEWRTEVASVVTVLDRLGARLENVSRQATVDWPPATPAGVRVFHEEEWHRLPNVLQAVGQDLARLEAEEVPRAEDAVDQASTDLRDAEDRLARVSAMWLQATTDLRVQIGDVDALQERQQALDEDRQRYVDARRLRDFGALEPLAGDDPHCPTCEQPLPDTLHGALHGPLVLTLEANLELIESDRLNVRAMLADSKEVLAASDDRVRALRGALDDARREVRTLKSALVQHAEAPSRAVIARQVRLADRQEALQALGERFGELEERLTELTEALRTVRGSLEDLSAAQSSEDQTKLGALARSLEAQLTAYGYGSFSGVELSPDSYLPEREGFDLESESSASDTVRLVWSYTIALLESGRMHPNNHPALVVIDEPGQHEIEAASLRALFARLAATSDTEQAIVATSMPFDDVDQLAEVHGMRVVRFDDRVLTRDAS